VIAALPGIPPDCYEYIERSEPLNLPQRDEQRRGGTIHARVALGESTSFAMGGDLVANDGYADRWDTGHRVDWR
jgi:hypothetical protein